MARAVSTAPPPGHTAVDSNVRFTACKASFMDRSISSNMKLFAPRKIMEDCVCFKPPLTIKHSSSANRSSTTAAAVPRLEASKVSSPSCSMEASETRMVPPVALAMRFKSSFLHRRTPITPASTMYFIQTSSIPLVVKITLAPAAIIFRILSFVTSTSRRRMASSSFGSDTMIWIPSFNFVTRKSKSNNAILAFCTAVGMAWLDRVQFRANPSTNVDSLELFPCCFKTLMALTG
mmetsp:Transcript_150994/g.263866  ORF Transcript_150994/g.263866 Transcript_150994/m.263866 type:complete len:234 (-) Transcript_150994:632-1333(-)